ncbi:MAG: FtsK/SpoIIIE domain-containing protein [Chthoniobacteraceae bacterium]
MSSRVDLRISHSLELLAALRRTAAEYAKREEELTRDLAARRSVIRRKFRDATARVDAALETQTADAQAIFATAESRIKTTYNERNARIERLRIAALRKLPKQAEEVRGKWIGDLQLKQVQAERRRDAELKKAELTYTACATKLAEQRTVLAALGKGTQVAFEGYGAFGRLLTRHGDATQEAEPRPADAAAMVDDFERRVSSAREQYKAFRRMILPRFFGVLHLSGMIVIILALGAVLTVVLGLQTSTYAMVGAAAAALIAVAVVVYRIGRSKAEPTAKALALSLQAAAELELPCETAVTAKREHDHGLILADFDRTCADIAEKWGRADQVQSDFEIRMRRKIEKQAPRAMARNAELFRKRLRLIAPERDARIERFTQSAAEQKRKFTGTHDAETAALIAEEAVRWGELESGWKRDITALFQAVGAMNEAVAAGFPTWSARYVEQWVPPATFTPNAPFARLEVDLASAPEALPSDPRLALPGTAQVSIPLALNFPEHGSLLFEVPNSGDAVVSGTINNLILRLLSTTPPGKACFTIYDPVGLGQNFAGLMHLADYEESLINRRIWTQRDQLDDRLAELSEHIEKVIQMYLRNEYATITEYNAQAGSVAEKYYFLVVADFPAGFSEQAAKRLQSIAASGPRCGVFTFIHWDPRLTLPDGFVPDELRKSSVCLRLENGQYVIDPAQTEAGATVSFDPPPEPELAAALVHKIGKSSIDSNRVEVPFSQIAPKPEELWKNDTTTELKIAIGRTGATKLQYLAIGKGTRQHALLAGKTGSGKSTLLHVIITNLALACSPEQVEFYLIDFKKGVEFKCYASARLPHARVVAIESDREFGLSVLHRVDEELKRRGDMFRKLGVQDIAGYKKAGGTEPVPRSLLIIDEFQEFFVEDDSIAQTASVLFDRIVRQGRAFGIHVLLGSQTLGGAYTLARATLGQMVIRVALQCNEADAYLIMDENNPAPRLLSRPGEGIYNDAAGALEGNSPFQVVWISDDERDARLEQIRVLAEAQHAYRSPIVFEGNAPSDIRENDPLRLALDTIPAAAPATGHAWLGAPNAIKGPTEAVFARQSGNHLLIVGQREEAALSMLGISLLALAAQYPLGTAKFYLLHAANPGSPDEAFIERIAAAIPHGVTIARGQEIAAAMNEIAEDLKARTAGGEGASGAPSVFLLIHGLQKFKKLRQEDEFDFGGGGDGGPSPAAQFGDIIREGSTYGIHVLAAIDTFNSVGRFISRKALSEFEMRVVFQMSANDSASLIDSPKAGNLGLHRALLHNEAQGYDETFRPYSPPDGAWLDEIAGKLARRR